MVSNTDGDDQSLSRDCSSLEVDSMPFLPVSQAVPLSPSVPDYGDSLLLENLEDELLESSLEVAPSLSVCGNIHQSQ